METSEEKLTALCKKYTELLEEHRTMQTTIKQNQRTITVVRNEQIWHYVIQILTVWVDMCFDASADYIQNNFTTGKWLNSSEIGCWR